MKKSIILLFTALLAFQFQSCKKDDPTPEVDQEEVGSATITFTEVEGEEHGDHYHYKDITDPEVITVNFAGEKFLPETGKHWDLEEGKSYRFNLVIKDFAGREIQQTFVDREDIHFAFILGIPDAAAHVQYADKKTDGTNVKVGVQGYITVLEETETFTMNYIMRHLNPGVKANINPKTDWKAKDYTKFAGANDLDLKFQMHFVEDGNH